MSDKTSTAKLNDLLFAQMERLADPKLNLELELKKATALAKVGTVLVNSAKQQVEMMKLMNNRKPTQLEEESKKPTKTQKRLSNG